MWELVAFKAPWAKVHPLRVIAMVAHEDQRLPIPEDCPLELRKLIVKCFQDAEDRPSVYDIDKKLSTIE